MDFNVKKLVRDAGTALSRVVQLTEEKLGTSEKTELDSHFEHLAERSDTTRRWTEKIVTDVEAVLTPNPGNRVGDYLLEKIDKKKPNRLSNMEYVGLDMIEAGNEFGPGTSYGSTLIKVGQCEQRLGSMEREFTNTANHCFVEPLHKFLDGEMKLISKERSILESKRLDLDACKNRVRKARSGLGGPVNKDGTTPEMVLEEAERDLRNAQSEFDRQAEITKLLLEGVSSSQTTHLRCLHEFVEAQANYYAQCHQRMLELQKEFSGLPPVGESNDPQPNSVYSVTPNSSKLQKAKVLCDYDAQDQSELCLQAGEIIWVDPIPDLEPDYTMGERGRQRGKVPKAFIEIING